MRVAPGEVLDFWFGREPFTRAVLGERMRTWFGADDAAAAEDAFRTAIQKNPNLMAPYYALAGIYLRDRKADKAVDDIEHRRIYLYPKDDEVESQKKPQAAM